MTFQSNQHNPDDHNQLDHLLLLILLLLLLDLILLVPFDHLNSLVHECQVQIVILVTTSPLSNRSQPELGGRHGSLDIPSSTTYLERSQSLGQDLVTTGKRSRRASVEPLSTIGDSYDQNRNSISEAKGNELEPLDIDIETKPFYKGECGRSYASNLLSGKPVGTYLFRLCSDRKELVNGKVNSNLFVLTYVGTNRLANLKIFRFVGEGLGQKKDKNKCTLYRTVGSLIKTVLGGSARPVSDTIG